MSEKSTWHHIAPFVNGGLSGMFATCCIQPIDMIKVRIQLLGEGGAKVASSNPVALAGKLIKEEGVLSLYRGLSAGLLRQATYTTARLGLFRTFSRAMTDPKENSLPFYKKAVAGLAAGGLGSILGTPADVALIRMQADSTLPVDQRRGYKNVVDALIKITREEGMAGLFSGNTPVVLRAMALNVGMLATNDQANESLKPYIKDPTLHSLATKSLSGFFAAFCSLPFDFVKTRVQKQKKLADGTYYYKSFAHCAGRVLKEEGPFAFYRGFFTYYLRIAPHAMITLFALDFLNIHTKDW